MIIEIILIVIAIIFILAFISSILIDINYVKSGSYNKLILLSTTVDELNETTNCVNKIQNYFDEMKNNNYLPGLIVPNFIVLELSENRLINLFSKLLLLILYPIFITIIALAFVYRFIEILYYKDTNKNIKYIPTEYRSIYFLNTITLFAITVVLTLILQMTIQKILIIEIIVIFFIFTFSLQIFNHILEQSIWKSHWKNLIEEGINNKLQDIDEMNYSNTNEIFTNFDTAITKIENEPSIPLNKSQGVIILFFFIIETLIALIPNFIS